MVYESGEEATPVPGSKPLSPEPLIGSLDQPPRGGEGVIDRFLRYTDALPTPAIFRLWAAIHAVGAAAERRVWTQFGLNKLYPNIYVFLVGPPGVGKTQAIEPAAEILRKSGACEIAPNDISKQSLLDALGKASRGTILDGRPFDYHFLALSVRELSNFMSKYDYDLAGLLTDLFDCPSVNDELKRTHNKGKAIVAPGLSFIMGTATHNLGHTISEEMWGSGFMARVIMVFSADEIIPEDMFAVLENDKDERDALTAAFNRIGQMKGPMMWSRDAQRLIRNFRMNQKEDAPVHNRLTNYVTRRWLHLGKLCMISALSHERMLVKESDFGTALGWLMAAEAEMPEIFKDLASHTDGQIHHELKDFVQFAHLRARKPLPASIVYQWLAQRVSSYAIPRIIEVALAADYIRQVAGTSGDDALFVPGVEGPLKPKGVL